MEVIILVLFLIILFICVFVVPRFLNKAYATTDKTWVVSLEYRRLLWKNSIVVFRLTLYLLGAFGLFIVNKNLVYVGVFSIFWLALNYVLFQREKQKLIPINNLFQMKMNEVKQTTDLEYNLGSTIGGGIGDWIYGYDPKINFWYRNIFFIISLFFAMKVFLF